MKWGIPKLNRIILFVFLQIFSVIYAGDNQIIRDTSVYKTVNGTSLYVFIDHMPTETLDQRPAMAFFHGGGWAYGHPDEFKTACRRYAAKNFVCFTFQYRLSITEAGEVPHPDISLIECVKDARSAIRWIRKNAETYSVDPNKIVACGQSAGGQLALGTALFDEIDETTDDTEISSVPNAFVLYSSNVNTIEAWADMLMGDRREEIWSVSPYHNLKAGMPSTLAFHGTADRMVPYWVVTRFRDKSIELGNDFELITFEERRHYLGDVDQDKKIYYDEEILKMTDAFLENKGFINTQEKN